MNIKKYIDKRLNDLIWITDNINFPDNSSAKTIILTKLDVYAHLKQWLKDK